MSASAARGGSAIGFVIGLAVSTVACGTQESRALCAVYADYRKAATLDEPVDDTTAREVLDRAQVVRDEASRLQAAADGADRAPVDDLIVAIDDIVSGLRGIDNDVTWATLQPLIADSLEALADADARIAGLLDTDCVPSA